ncbi:hypothetical protein ACWGI8_06045 [Streptomyces sp. NPDC054841]
MAGPSGDGKKDLEVEGVTLQSFRSRMEVLLSELEKSPAEHRKLGDNKITADSYGQGFGAADALSKAYEQVRAKLEELSRTFGETIEGMGIAVHVAEKGYTGVDLEERERFQQIQKRAQERYDNPDGTKAAPTKGDTAAKNPDAGPDTTDTGDSGGLG